MSSESSLDAAFRLATEGVNALEENRHSMPPGWLPDDVLLVCRALLSAHAELEKMTAERDMFHQLACVVALMDGNDTTGTVKVFRSCMPSLASLFREGDGDALYLNEAADRAIDALTARGK